MLIQIELLVRARHIRPCQIEFVFVDPVTQTGELLERRAHPLGGNPHFFRRFDAGNLNAAVAKQPAARRLKLQPAVLRRFELAGGKAQLLVQNRQEILRNGDPRERPGHDFLHPLRRQQHQPRHQRIIQRPLGHEPAQRIELSHIEPRLSDDELGAELDLLHHLEQRGIQSRRMVKMRIDRPARKEVFGRRRAGQLPQRHHALGEMTPPRRPGIFPRMAIPGHRHDVGQIGAARRRDHAAHFARRGVASAEVDHVAVTPIFRQQRGIIDRAPARGEPVAVGQRQSTGQLGNAQRGLFEHGQTRRSLLIRQLRTGRGMFKKHRENPVIQAIAETIAGRGVEIHLQLFAEIHELCRPEYFRLDASYRKTPPASKLNRMITAE
ncbi:hypothetical protein SDC9_68224 [bioreactor metagenome]|uniref:Uncharacterized protein n=1 Tax=bioreactor metagenome TaxID=1076179 RepID=A0A644Y0A4_9ZZZZ